MAPWKHLRHSLLALSISFGLVPVAGAAGATCRSVFSTASPRLDSEASRHLDHLESIYALEKLNAAETRLLLGLRAQNRLDLDLLYGRYRDLIGWSRFQRAMVVTNTALIRLAAESLRQQLSVEAVTLALDFVAVHVSARAVSGFKMTVSHSDQARLAEIAVATGEPIGHVVATFNENVKTVGAAGPNGFFITSSPVERAMARTSADFDRPGPSNF